MATLTKQDLRRLDRYSILIIDPVVWALFHRLAVARETLRLEVIDLGD